MDYTENTDSLLNVFYAFIKKDIGSLNKMELTWYKETFKNYDVDLINYYHDISFQKTVEINERINNYYIKHNNMNDIDKKYYSELPFDI